MTTFDHTDSLHTIPQMPDSNRSIKFISSRYFIGCNRYHQSSVLRRGINFGPLSGTMTALAGPDFALKFIERFCSVKSPIPQNGLKDDFITRLQLPQGVGFEELFLEAVLVMEVLAAFARREIHAITYAKIEKHEKHTDLIWNSALPNISRRASEVALTGVLGLLPKKLFVSPVGTLEDFSVAFKNLQSMAREEYRLSPTTSILKLAAQRRGIPCETLGRQHLMLGQGDRQQHFFSAMTSNTPVPGQLICMNKSLTSQRLTELRLPVPRQIKVRTLKGALAAVKKLGFPVVVKPLRGKKGGGVSAGLTTFEDIAPAFKRAQDTGPEFVLVESFEAGYDHRLLVIGGKLVAASMRKPSSIRGDGGSTVEELIDELNSDPLRDGFRLEKVKKNAELLRLLREANLSLSDVLSEGREIALQSVANLSAGGLPIDVTDKVHPDNRDMAVRAALGVGLDVAGVDFLTTDITRSYREIGGAIVEMNARPGLRMHIWPDKEGKPRDVAGAILNLFYAPEQNGRIPIIAVAGDKATGAVARVLDMILRGAGRFNALTLRNDSFVNGAPADLSDEQKRFAPLSLLRDPQVSTLVTTVSPRRAVRRGLLFEECTVSVIMDKKLEADTQQFHLGLDILEPATRKCFVVGAGNAVVVNRLKRLGSPLESRQLILVGERLNDPVVQEHLNSGHVAVTTMWLDGKTRIALFSGTKLEASFNTVVRGSRDGRSKTRRLKNGKMFAIAAAVGLGLSGTEIKHAFRNAPRIVEEESVKAKTKMEAEAEEVVK